MKSRRVRLPPLRSLLPASAQYSLPGRDRQRSNNTAAAIALNGLKGTAMRKQRFALSRVYTLLEPGPVVLLTTAHRDARNVMPMSWYSLLDFEPPLLACVVSAANHSQQLLRASRQCVLNIPTVELARQLVGCGNCSGSAVDKFARFKLACSAASQVSAPLLDACYASLECRVVDTRMVRRYEQFVLEVVAAWVDTSNKDPPTLHHRGYGRFMVAGPSIQLRSKMR